MDIKMSNYNLYIDPEIKAIPYNNNKKFTKKEIEKICKLYPDKSNREIAIEFGRTVNSIKNIAYKYKLQKSKEYLATKPGCYRKGKIPWNKNKKGYMDANKTSFKKGNIPKNLKPLGTISLRHKKNAENYKYVKTSKGWILLHRYIWGTYKGRITKNYIIIFKDGNTMNCNIDNLELISRKENLKRNLNREKAAESLRKLWRKEFLHQQYGLSPVSKFGEKYKF